MRQTTFKLYHNIFLAAIFLLLMDERSFFGLWFHEIAGLAICLFYVLHKVLNWTWIKETTKHFFGKMPGKQRIHYIIDVLLLIGFTMIVISGMAIAHVINFSWLGFDMENRIIYRWMHTSISMIVLIIAGIHLGLHWDWVLARFKRPA